MSITLNELNAMLDAARAKAMKRNRKLVRLGPGWYVTSIDGTLWEIDQADGQGDWNAREFDNISVYADNTATLNDMKRQLGVA